jgi:hypothetical protein
MRASAQCHLPSLAEGAQGQAFAGFFLVNGMNVVGASSIDRDGDARIRHVLGREGLGFPHLGPGVVAGHVASNARWPTT